MPRGYNADPIPDKILANALVRDQKSLFRTIIATFIVGLLIGGCILVILTSIVRIHLINSKEAEVRKGSAQNPRIDCDMTESVNKSGQCAFIILRNDGGHGTGISIGDGLIVTNKHVVAGATDFSTRVDGSETPVKLLASSSDYDIALMKVDKSVPSCVFYDAANLKSAEDLYAIGWPKEKGQIAPAVTRGIFSRFNTQSDGIAYIQTDAAINPGNSGGPLINECGIVGMNTAKFSWYNKETPIEGLSLAMPSRLVLQIVKSLQK